MKKKKITCILPVVSASPVLISKRLKVTQCPVLMTSLSSLPPALHPCTEIPPRHPFLSPVCIPLTASLPTGSTNYLTLRSTDNHPDLITNLSVSFDVSNPAECNPVSPSSTFPLPQAPLFFDPPEPLTHRRSSTLQPPLPLRRISFPLILRHFYDKSSE